MYIYVNVLTGWLVVGEVLVSDPDVLRDYYIGFARNRKEALLVIKNHKLYRSGTFGLNEIRKFVKENWIE